MALCETTRTAYQSQRLEKPKSASTNAFASGRPTVSTVATAREAEVGVDLEHPY
ncbi:hypothetical protein [Halostagnicola bangensis]